MRTETMITNENGYVGGMYGGQTTMADFFATLNRIRGDFDWHLTRRRGIRATLKDHPENRLFDPLTAVAYATTGEFIPEGRWSEAAAALGLSHAECAEIVSSSSYDWHPESRQGALRHRILGACFLQTDAEAPVLAAFLARTRSVGTPH